MIGIGSIQGNYLDEAFKLFSGEFLFTITVVTPPTWKFILSANTKAIKKKKIIIMGGKLCQSLIFLAPIV